MGENISIYNFHLVSRAFTFSLLGLNVIKNMFDVFQFLSHLQCECDSFYFSTTSISCYHLAISILKSTTLTMQSVHYFIYSVFFLATGRSIPKAGQNGALS